MALAAARVLPTLGAYFAAGRGRPRRPVWIFLGALVLCTPYLLYTYQLTGKVFYWGTNGGDVLYWMTVGGTGLFGTWLPMHQVREHPDLASEHLTFLETTHALPAVEGDKRFKRRALENLRARPEVYAANWVGNVARLLFNYPWSRREQSLRTYGYLLPNAALLLAFGASLYPAFRNRAAVPPALAVLLAFVAVAVAIHSLVSSTGRLFVVNIPVLLLWVFFVFHHFVSVEVREVAAP